MSRDSHPILPMVRLAELSTSPHRGVVRVPLFSPRLGLRRWLAVQLPPGMREPEASTPVVYLFRGHHSEWFHPREDSSRESTLPDLVNQAIEAGRLPPLILVIPCLGSDDRRFHTVAADWSNPELAPQVPGMGLGRFESHLVQELIPQVEAALGLPTPRRIAIGFSLGGLVAFMLGWRHPGLFQSLAAYDGSFFHEPPDDEDSILHHPLFDPVFARPRDRTSVEAHSPIHLAERLTDEELARTHYYLQSGPERAEPYDANFERTQALIRALERRGVANRLPDVLEEGHHNWYTADQFALNSLITILKPA